MAYNGEQGLGKVSKARDIRGGENLQVYRNNGHVLLTRSPNVEVSKISKSH